MIITLIHNWNQGAPLESEIDGSSDFSYFRSKFSKMEKWRVKYSFDLITLYIQSQNSYNFFFYKIVFELFLYNFIDIKKTFESTKWLWKIKPRITFGDSKLELYWLKTFFFQSRYPSFSEKSKPKDWTWALASFFHDIFCETMRFCHEKSHFARLKI